LITNGEFVSVEGDDPTMVVICPENQGNVNFVNCAFWGPCNQNAILDGKGTTTFSDCIFLHWDRNKEGRYAIRANDGSLMIKSCNFLTDSPQVLIGEKVKNAIVSGNLIKGKIRIDNRSNNAIVKDNLSHDGP
jgi:hypothetical protein